MIRKFKNIEEVIDELQPETVSVVIDYKNPSGFKDNIVGKVMGYGPDFIIISPTRFDGVEFDIYNWEYIISIRTYKKTPD